jgi:cellulose synthase/poly-beta-1,6-N-acetylglucosamine synthase-like glycosyltransferase
MIIIAEIACWLSLGLIFHSYVLFPLIVQFLAKGKSINPPEIANKELPFISILMSAYNEEIVIEEKILSILSSDYPKELLEIIVGSDASSDQTDYILERLKSENPKHIFFFPFAQRRGKPNVINTLVDRAKGDILILTDANVIFDNQTLRELIKPFTDPKIGLVDSQMINKGIKESGISHQEKAYISREVSIKHHESLIWGSMMGPFGGCFAIRKELFKPIPNNFLVDDFFLNMIVLENGYLAINNPSAKVYEDVSNNLGIEYRRKIRIATGNFQNLKRFRKLLWPPWSGTSFSFLSHKVIRWFGPFLLIVLFFSLAYLSSLKSSYLAGFIGILTFFFIPVLDHFLKKLRIHISFFRFITHFCAMNLAMFVGFLRYGKGVKTNVWQPTKRHQ